MMRGSRRGRHTLRLQLVQLLVKELEMRLGEVDVGEAAIL